MSAVTLYIKGRCRWQQFLAGDSGSFVYFADVHGILLRIFGKRRGEKRGHDEGKERFLKHNNALKNIDFCAFYGQVFKKNAFLDKMCLKKAGSSAIKNVNEVFVEVRF